MEDYNRYILRILSLVSLLVFSIGCISRQLPTELQENSHRSDTLKENLGKNGDQPDNLIKERTIPKGLEEVSTPFGKMYIAVPASVVQTEKEETPREDIKKAEEVSAINKSRKRDRVQTEKYNNAVRAAAKTGVKNESESPITLNFDDADIYEVIRSISEILNINYIIDTAVRGKVTIQTTGEIDRKDVWAVFFQILEANGLTAIREGEIYRIVPLKDAQRYAILSRYGTDSENVAPTERVIMQIIPLKYADGAEIVKIISPFVSEAGTIVSHGDSNTLIVVDKWINIMKVLQLVEVFDADILDKIGHRFFFLKYADSKETAEMLGKIVGISKNSYQMIPINRLNAILAVTKDDRIFNRIEEYLKEIDVPSDVSQRQIYVYSIKNGTADELSSLLKNIFGSENSSSKQNKKEGNVQKGDLAAIEANNPFLQNSGTSKSGNESTDGNSGSGSSAVSGTLREKVNITPDSIRNALIIEATQSDYRIVENILSKLDVLPRQVLIEMTIAEISLDDSTKLGVEWNYNEGKGGPSTSLISGAITAGADGGLNLIFGESIGNRWSAALSALATNSKANILATPSIMASDNKEAVINISQEIPVISSVYDVSGSNSNVVSTNVQYRNTGLILTVTPHINENGLVSMTISQELSEQLEKGVPIGGTTYPAFFKRTVNTNLVVKHNQTIVIGGLIRETKSKSRAGVPVLNKIPVVGFLFGSDSDTFSKNELVIFITPHVIIRLDDVDAVTNEFKVKMNEVVSNMR